MGNNLALFDGMAKIYVRARVEAHRAWCRDLSPSTVSNGPRWHQHASHGP